jgi:hypothetical protein
MEDSGLIFGVVWRLTKKCLIISLSFPAGPHFVSNSRNEQKASARNESIGGSAVAIGSFPRASQSHHGIYYRYYVVQHEKEKEREREMEIQSKI